MTFVNIFYQSLGLSANCASISKSMKIINTLNTNQLKSDFFLDEFCQTYCHPSIPLTLPVYHDIADVMIWSHTHIGKYTSTEICAGRSWTAPRLISLKVVLSFKLVRNNINLTKIKWLLCIEFWMCYRPYIKCIMKLIIIRGFFF